MADMAMESVRKAFDAFIARDLAPLDEVYANNENVAKLGAQISDYLVRVSASGVSLSNEKRVSALHTNVGDIERIAELADNLTKYTRREVKDNLVFSDGINERLAEMHEKLHEQYGLVKRSVLDMETGLVAPSDDLEEAIDNMRKELVADHIVRLGQGKCRPENNTVFINLVSNLERIGDHLNFIMHSGDNA